MPAMKKIEANPDYRPTNAAEKAAWETAKARGPINVTFITAIENVNQSKGLYRLCKEEAGRGAPQPSASIDSMTSDELKEYCAKLGITIRKKRVNRGDLIGLIRESLMAIEVEDDEAEVDMDSEDA